MIDRSRLDPESAAILALARRIDAIGTTSGYGYRMPGTDADHATARLLAEELQAIGLQDITLEDVPLAVAFPENWSLELIGDGQVHPLPCSFIRYAGYTPHNGIEADVAYLGKGTEADFEAVDVAGRIVVVDLVGPESMPHSGPPYAVYDAHDTIAGDAAHFAWPLVNIAGSYARAVAGGAIGWVGILDVFGDDTFEYHHWYARHELPALTVGSRSGAQLRSPGAKVRMRLTGTRGGGRGINVYGTIPAARQSDEWVLLKSHYDGWATNEASGAAVTVATARQLLEGPALDRNVLVLFRSSHFGVGWTVEPPQDQQEVARATAAYCLEQEWDRFETKVGMLMPRIAVGNNVEMISRQYVPDPTGGWRPTDRAAIRLWGISGAEKGRGNAALLECVSRAIEQQGLDRSIISDFMVGDGMELAAMGLPMVSHISHNAYQFSSKDTPETIMAGDLGAVARAFAQIVRAQCTLAFAAFRPVRAYSLADLEVPGADCVPLTNAAERARRGCD